MVVFTLVFTKYTLLTPVYSESSLNIVQFGLLTLSIVCICAAGYIINDVFDVPSDLINKPNKVYIDKTISTKKATVSYYVITIVGLLLGTIVSFSQGTPSFSFIFVSIAVGLYLYSSYFKRIAFVGNILTSVFVSFVIITLYLFEKNTSTSYVIQEQMHQYNRSTVISCYIGFSFILTLLRELIKDVEDIKGDYAVRMHTLPIVIGIQRTNRVIFLIASLVLIAFILLSKGLFSSHLSLAIYMVVGLILPFIFFVFKLWQAKTKIHYHYLSQLLKLIMLLGICSMILFKFP